MKNVIKIISVILVSVCFCVGCSGSKLSGDVRFYEKVVLPVINIELYSAKTVAFDYGGDKMQFEDYSYEILDFGMGENVSCEIKEITLNDLFTSEQISGEYMILSGISNVALKIYGVSEDFSYGDEVGIEFTVYIDGESYEDITFKDESNVKTTETIMPKTFSYIYLAGHVLSDNNGNYALFYINCADENVKIYFRDFNVCHIENGNLFGGATLYQLTSNRAGDTQEGYLIVTKNEKLIMIDGGQFFDNDVVSELLHKYKCEVDYWFITHPHDDHIGAAINIMKYNPEIKIKHFCFSFPNISWIQDKADRGLDDVNAPTYTSEFLQLVADNSIDVIEIAGGDLFDVDGIRIKVINDLLLCDSNPLNEASMVIKVFTANKSILFLGDAGPQLGKYLLDSHYDDLKSDIVQMAHHGQNGVTEDVYQVIDPEICLWPTKDWVYNNRNGLAGAVDSGNLSTFTVRKWMEKLRVKHHYIAKNGTVSLK